MFSDEEIRQRLHAYRRAPVFACLPERVTTDTSLDALGAESLDLVEVTLEIEHEFMVLMPERSILQTATAVVGEGVLEQDGLLTDAGKHLLAARMPEIDTTAWPDDVTVASLRSAFLRVDVWVRLIRFLMEQSPRECPSCHGALVPGTPARVACRTCAVEFDLPHGDELDRLWVEEYMARRPASA